MEGRYAISFRFTKDLFSMDIFDEFLADQGINVLQSSMGLHEEECAVPHYHYHLVCANTFSFKAPPTQTFKNKYKVLTKLFKDNSNSLSIKVTDRDSAPPAPVASKEEELPEEGRGCITCIKRFLNYPLKEKKPVKQYCRAIDVDQSCLEGHAEWLAVQTYRKKLKARKLAEESKKGMLYAHLDKNSYTAVGLPGIVRDTLLFYKGNKDAPHPQYQVKSAEIYAYHKGYWSIDDIIHRYLGRDKESAYEKAHRQIPSSFFDAQE